MYSLNKTSPASTPKHEAVSTADEEIPNKVQLNSLPRDTKIDFQWENISQLLSMPSFNQSDEEESRFENDYKPCVLSKHLEEPLINKTEAIAILRQYSKKQINSMAGLMSFTAIVSLTQSAAVQEHLPQSSFGLVQKQAFVVLMFSISAILQYKGGNFLRHISIPANLKNRQICACILIVMGWLLMSIEESLLLKSVICFFALPQFAYFEDNLHQLIITSAGVFSMAMLNSSARFQTFAFFNGAFLLGIGLRIQTSIISTMQKKKPEIQWVALGYSSLLAFLVTSIYIIVVSVCTQQPQIDDKLIRHTCIMMTWLYNLLNGALLTAIAYCYQELMRQKTEKRNGPVQMLILTIVPLIISVCISTMMIADNLNLRFTISLFCLAMFVLAIEAIEKAK